MIPNIAAFKNKHPDGPSGACEIPVQEKGGREAAADEDEVELTVLRRLDAHQFGRRERGRTMQVPRPFMARLLAPFVPRCKRIAVSVHGTASGNGFAR